MKEFNVLFDGKTVNDLIIIEDSIDAAKAYANELIPNYENYGFTIETIKTNNQQQ